MVIGTPTVLNLIPGGVMKVIHVNQVNENIEIQFRIMNGAQPFNVPEGVSCTIRGTKGDNFGYAAAVAVTAGSNIVTVTLTEQLTAVAGAGNIFELVFVGASDDMKVSTENFLLDVERAALGEDTVISDSDLAYADQVLDQLQSVGAVNAQVQQNKANIAAEITRATAAEQTLQQNINAEAAARQAADNTLQSNINAEASSRATTDASLQSQINQLVAPSGEAPSAAEVQNARIGTDGTVYPTLGDAIRTQNSLLKSQLEVIQDYDWTDGYINSNGEVQVETGGTRCHSEYLICPPNAVIQYQAELHSSILGISFYDNNKRFILGYAHNDSAHPINTVTSPDNACFLRLSSARLILNTTFVSFDSTGLIALSDRISEYENRINKYIPFVTTGSSRSQLYTDISNIYRVSVVDQSYDVALYYDGSSQNTGWQKEINLLIYSNPVSLQIRKTDNSAMPERSAERVVIADRASDLATLSDIRSEKTVYVSNTGNDANSGLSRDVALASIQKAIDSGAKNILVKEGTYSNGFTLSGKTDVKISLDHFYDTFTVGSDEDNPKIIIDGANTADYGVTIYECFSCMVSDIEVMRTKKEGFVINKCADITVENCVVHDIALNAPASGYGGFVIARTDGDFKNCVAYNIGTQEAQTTVPSIHLDGFNIHISGTTNFYNCSAWNCLDDGISHHDACYGTIDGGEWYGCGKGGIASPTHGAKVNIYNVYAHHNVYGLYAGNDSAVTDRGNIMIMNSAFIDNISRDLYVADYYHGIAYNCARKRVEANNITFVGGVIMP